MTDNRTTELLPCPFCGGEARGAHEDYGDTHYWRVYCDTIGCAFGMSKVFHSEAEAITAWNARAERTCEFNIKDNMNETEGMGDVWIECSACHCVFDFYADEWLMKMSYCPNCGARVVDA